jgi:formamidopyrimidine-DNA glycosylase
MPELPEVETIARGLAKRVTGDVIETVWLGEKSEPLKSPATEIVATLQGALIGAVRRMGKHIVFDLQRNEKSHRTKKLKTNNVQLSQWIVHLGMTGRLQVCEPEAEVLKHTHAIAKLASGRELRFVDPRRFGRLSVASAGNFDAGGVEPLEVELDKFTTLFRGRKDRSNPLCSTRSCYVVWEIFMPTNLCFAQESAPAAERGQFPVNSCAACFCPCAKC